MTLHDWRECTNTNCKDLSCQKLAETYGRSWEQEETERKAKHTCVIITVDFKNKRVISRRETSS